MTQIAVVTGATGGVGRATVREVAARGFDIGLIARGQAGLDAAAAEVVALGRRACPVSADVARWDEVDAAASRITDELGPIDVWINNAMTTIFGAVRDIDPASVERATAVTYLGQVHGTMAALARMRQRDAGTIVSVGSALAFRGIPLQAAYCGAKFAVRGFMESLRTELLAEGSHVRICQIHLPAVNTTQFGWCRVRVDTHPVPVPPIYQPEIPARAIADLIETGARQDIVGVWNWLLVHLNNIIPGVGDHYMARTGIRSQLTDLPICDDRPDDLFAPADNDVDHGSHGIFDDRTGGMLNRNFLAGLPGTAADFAIASGQRIAEVVRQRVPAGARVPTRSKRS